MPIKHALELYRKGHVTEALEVAHSAPMSIERFRLLAKILIRQNVDGSNIRKVLKLTEKWKRFAPGSPEPWAQQLELHIYNRQMRLAKESYIQVRKRAPKQSTTFFYKGLLLQLSGRLMEAHDAYLTSIKCHRTTDHHDTTPARNSAIAAEMAYRVEMGEHPGSHGKKRKGILSSSKVIMLLRSCVEAWDEEARQSEQCSEKLTRELSNSWRLLGLNGMGKEWSPQCFRKSLRWNEHLESARSNLLFALNYSPEISPQEIYQEHLKSGRWFHQHHPERKLAFKNVPEWDKNLKVGYISSDFRNHSVAHFILPVLQQHEEHHVTAYAYSTGADDDNYTDIIRDSASHFRSIRMLSTEERLEQIINDQIDILVDLNGHSGDGCIALLATRAAPVQVTWIGYPNTTGLDSVDYRIVDRVTDPLPEAQRLCTEQLLFMPRTFSVYQAHDELPELDAEKHKPTTGICFGSFNAWSKLNDALIGTWSEILSRTPGSTLLIKNLAMDRKSNREKVLDKFTLQGIESTRIKFRGYVENRYDHLKVYNEVDLTLDSFPYNGTTTNCESFVMGVPVLTRAGKDHRSRVGASQLTVLSLEELIATSEEEYVAKAVALAGDRARLAMLSESLREKMLSSPLMDAEGFTRELETVYRQIWITWCEQIGQSRGG